MDKVPHSICDIEYKEKSLFGVIPFIWLLYYSVLLYILLSWNNMTTAPNYLYRILYLTAVAIPAIFKTKILVPIVVLFYSISYNGFSYSYLPTDSLYYLIIFLIGSVIYKSPTKNKPCLVLLALFVYMSIIDIVTGSGFTKSSYSYLIFLFMLLCTDKNKSTIELLSWSIILASLVLSLSYLFNQDLLFETNNEFERLGVKGNNYGAMIIGMGVPIAVYYLLNERVNKIKMVLCVLTIVVTLITMLLAASRGALLNLVVVLLPILLYKKIKTKYKLIFIVVSCSILLILYKYGYFNIIEYRIENDTGGGSGRSDIWDMKLYGFFNEYGALSWIFGIGTDAGIFLGGNSVMYSCFHNDFLAFLVEYGLIGLLLFVTVMMYPLYKARGANRFFVLLLFLYLVSSCLTLEPFSSGWLNFYIYYLFAYCVANQYEGNIYYA